MDPNSGNQRWSKWHFIVTPGGMKWPTFADIRLAAAKFGRINFGSVATMNVSIEYDRGRRKRFVRIRVRAEGVPVHDPAFAAFMAGEWQRWATRGFGNGTTCQMIEAKLEAGDRQDGSPRDQLIILEAPAIRVTD